MEIEKIIQSTIDELEFTIKFQLEYKSQGQSSWDLENRTKALWEKLDSLREIAETLDKKEENKIVVKYELE